MQTLTNTLKDKFFAPVVLALSRAKNFRACNEYTDQEHLNSGIERVLQNVASGRDWVQGLRLKSKLNLFVSNFFISLRSSRRKQLVEEVNMDVRAQTDQAICHQKDDPLSVHAELVGPSNGTVIRRVTYKDSLTGKVYRFITNEL